MLNIFTHTETLGIRIHWLTPILVGSRSLFQISNSYIKPWKLYNIGQQGEKGVKGDTGQGEQGQPGINATSSELNIRTVEGNIAMNDGETSTASCNDDEVPTAEGSTHTGNVGRALDYGRPAEKRKEEIEKQNQADRLKHSSSYAQAFQMFRDKKALSEVVVALDLKADVVTDYYSDYLCLIKLKRLVVIYCELKDDLAFFLYLYRRIKDEELDNEYTEELLHNIKELSTVSESLFRSKKQVEELYKVKINLQNEIKMWTEKRDNYDGTSC